MFGWCLWVIWFCLSIWFVVVLLVVCCLLWCFYTGLFELMLFSLCFEFGIWYFGGLGSLIGRYDFMVLALVVVGICRWNLALGGALYVWMSCLLLFGLILAILVDWPDGCGLSLMILVGV